MNLGAHRAPHRPRHRPAALRQHPAAQARQVHGAGQQGVQEGRRRRRDRGRRRDQERLKRPPGRRRPVRIVRPASPGTGPPASRRSCRWLTASPRGKRSPATTGASSTTWRTAWPATTTTHRIWCRSRSSGSARASSATSPGSLEGWLARIVTNVFLDEVRRRQRRPTDALPDDPDGCSRPRPAADEVTTGLSDEVQRALAVLPDDFRVPVVLCDVSDLSYEQIADATGVPIGTVRSRIHRGRRLLRAALVGRGVMGHDRASSPPDDRHLRPTSTASSPTPSAPRSKRDLADKSAAVAGRARTGAARDPWSSSRRLPVPRRALTNGVLGHEPPRPTTRRRSRLRPWSPSRRRQRARRTKRLVGWGAGGAAAAAVAAAPPCVPSQAHGQAVRSPPSSTSRRRRAPSVSRGAGVAAGAGHEAGAAAMRRRVVTGIAGVVGGRAAPLRRGRWRGRATTRTWPGSCCSSPGTRRRTTTSPAPSRSSGRTAPGSDTRRSRCRWRTVCSTSARTAWSGPGTAGC